MMSTARAMQRLNSAGHCPEHGQYVSTTFAVHGFVIGGSCPTCRARAMEVAEQANIRAAAAASDARAAARLTRAGIPQRFMAAQASFENYEPVCREAEAVRNGMRNYIDQFAAVLREPFGVVLCGNAGTGKTHLACAAVRAVAAKGLHARYTTSQELLHEVRDATRAGYGERRSFHEATGQYISPVLLVVDELGLHNSSSNEDYQTLFTIVDRRYLNGVPTIVCSNFSYANLQRELDPRFMERVLCGTGPVFSCSWESYRGRGRLRGA